MSLKKVTKIPLGVKNKNGRIYSGECFSEISNRVKEETIFGELDHPSSFEISMARVSHVIDKIEIEDNFVNVHATILKTDLGRKLSKSLLNELVLSPRGSGIILEDGNLSNYKLYTFDLVKKDTSSFSYE